MAKHRIFDPKIILPESSKGIRAFLRFNLRHEVFQNNTGSAILSELKGRGLGIRSQDFFRIRNEVLNEDKFKAAISVLPDNEFVPQAQWNTDHGIEISKNLQYKFKVAGRDKTTGRFTTRFYNLASDTEKTQAEIENELFQILANDPEAYQLDVTKVELDYILARPEFAGSR